MTKQLSYDVIYCIHMDRMSQEMGKKLLEVPATTSGLYLEDITSREELSRQMWENL